MNEITLNAYAKINLSLKILRRRPDGYHDIRSLMQGIGLYDVIKITSCAQNGTKYNLPHCEIDGIVVYLCSDVKTIPTDMSNLAFKGIKAVLDELNTRLPDSVDALVVEIEKRLPVAAGIAGGSGNAAACMLGLNALLGNPFSLRELMEIGVKVGADVPFSLIMNAAKNSDVLDINGLDEACTAAWVGGIGEIVEPTEPVKRSVIMVNPGIAVSTKGAYEAIDAVLEKAAPEPEVGSDSRLGTGVEAGTEAGEVTPNSELFFNDFESYTIAEYSEARRLWQMMNDELDADNVLMSGSGPTMVAYYENTEEAKRDFEKMSELCLEEPDWRAWFTETGI